ncbi:hypothetical protein LguiA_012789 [Lonicera macranthoides]
MAISLRCSKVQVLRLKGPSEATSKMRALLTLNCQAYKACLGNGVGSISDDETEAPATMTFEELMTSLKPIILNRAEFWKIVMGCAEMYTPHAHPVQL